MEWNSWSNGADRLMEQRNLWSKEIDGAERLMEQRVMEQRMVEQRIIKVRRFWGYLDKVLNIAL